MHTRIIVNASTANAKTVTCMGEHFAFSLLKPKCVQPRLVFCPIQICPSLPNSFLVCIAWRKGNKVGGEHVASVILIVPMRQQLKIQHPGKREPP